MRIVGGKYRGKKLWAPQGKNVRPTSERAREAIFNILYSKLGGDYSQLNLLDIFCGTGAFGFEALSRGFKHVSFVDTDTAPILHNAKLFASEQEKFEIIKADATHLPHAKRRYDIIFMDAPYAKGLTAAAVEQIIKNDWPAERAILIIEIRKDEDLDLPSDYELIDERIYGLARMLFIQKK